LPRTDTWQAPAATAQEAQGSHCLPRRSRSGLPFVTEIPNSHVTAVLGAESGCKLAPMLFSILQGIPRLSQEAWGAFAPKPPPPEPDYTAVWIICGAAVLIAIIAALAWGKLGSRVGNALGPTNEELSEAQKRRDAVDRANRS